jgi:L-threonylcarbamoyladenylate synthase
LIAPSLESALRVARDVSPTALQVARRYWPGPLTLVLRGDPRLPSQLRKNGTVAVRVPGPSPALDLVRAFGAPLTASSANLSGQRPLGNEAELRAVFGDRLAAIAPGESPGELPSTIVDLTSDEVRVLRQGAIVLPPRLELES